MPSGFGVHVTNHVDDGELAFEVSKRAQKVSHLVIHESVTLDQPTTVRVLNTRKTKSGHRLGVHLIVAPDGHVSCHADLVNDVPIHGNQLNGSSIGVEVVNPYYPSSAKPPFTRTIPATWWTDVPKGKSKKYVTPTDAQIAALKALLPWVAAQVGVPWVCPTIGLNATTRRIEGWDEGVKPPPGVVAHRDFSSHADGRWVIEQLFG